MITFYHIDQDRLTQTTKEGGWTETPPNTVWIDLYKPNREEEASVECALGINVPTLDDMQEIEASSRLYTEDGSVIMTLSILHRTAEHYIDTVSTTFIVSGDLLVTVRYADVPSFSQFTQKAKKNPSMVANGSLILLGHLEQISDNLADVLEGATQELETLSRNIFNRDQTPGGVMPNYREAIHSIGHVGDLATKAKGCLLNLTRLLLFFAGQSSVNHEAKERMKILMQDASSIDEHARFLSAKVSFLMEATMGLINLEQNNIIKMFSVAAVIFLPPTLIASIYGMNFKYLPELTWHNGYFFALLLMALSAAVPLWLFWRKKWL